MQNLSALRLIAARGYSYLSCRLLLRRRGIRHTIPERLRPCVCIDGLVFVGYIDEYGEEREGSYPCRRCASEAGL